MKLYSRVFIIMFAAIITSLYIPMPVWSPGTCYSYNERDLNYTVTIPALYPNAVEILHGKDDDCNGQIDDILEIHVPTEYVTIQEAIHAANDGDVIIIHEGIYYENIDFLGKAITIRSVEPTNPDVVADTVIDGRNLEENVFRFSNGEEQNSSLSGVTIRNGGDRGIYCYQSSPTITNCNISGNSGRYSGGIYCNSSSPTITNCNISENSGQYGGGIYCISSTPTITNCNISGNSSHDGGGGIYCNSSSPTITNCIITGNSANSSGVYGGGMYYWNSSPIIVNCIISRNFASYNCGGIYCSKSIPHIINCIIYGNRAASDPPESSSYPDREIYCYESEPQILYSDIRGGYKGEGNIDAYPLFVDPNEGDYHLQPGSPCIDAGITGEYVPYDIPRYDKNGNLRDSNPDMGAYEFFICSPTPEVCDSKDNDCDGRIDEDLIQTCTTACGIGEETCQNGRWVDCTAPQPQVEVCDDRIDNDCDGHVDENCCNGDINKDGSITPKDALIVFQCYLNPGSCHDCDDVNEDGNVTPADALCLFQNYLKQPSCLDNRSCTDSDSDGVTTCNGDCDDNNAHIHPGAQEICDNGIDEDCSGADISCGDVDNDRDGYTPNQGDCDDHDSSIHPKAPEICDGLDNNCDDRIDEGVQNTYYEDKDGDTYGNPDNHIQACVQPSSGYAAK